MAISMAGCANRTLTYGSLTLSSLTAALTIRQEQYYCCDESGEIPYNPLYPFGGELYKCAALPVLAVLCGTSLSESCVHRCKRVFAGVIKLPQSMGGLTGQFQYLPGYARPLCEADQKRRWAAVFQRCFRSFSTADDADLRA